MSQRRAHNKIPQDQDDYLMAMARREVRAAEAVSAFLDAFPDFTAPDGDRVKRATFLYRHRLVRVRAEGRAEQGETTAQPDQPASAPGAETAAGTVATLNDADVGAGEATHVESPKLVIPSEADAPKLPQVGDRVRVVAGFVIGSCGVVREVVSDGPRPSIAVVFDEDVGLWFSPECLVVVGDEAPDETPSAGGMDGEVRRAERERDEARAEADSLRARVGKLDAEVAELSARLARPLLLLKPQPDLHVEALRESAAAARAVSDALQALAAQQADAVAAKDAEIATLKLHLDDLRRQAGLS